MSKKSTPKKTKVLLTRTLHQFVMKKLEKKFELEIHRGPFPMPKKRLIAKIKDKDGLVCFPYDNVDRDVIEAAKKLRTISTFSVGFDHIDTKYAKQQKISVGYTPEVLTVTTANLTLILILDLLRRVSEGDRLIRAGKWKAVYGADTYVGDEIKGMTLGILGLGRIGRVVSQRAQVFGIKIIYHKRNKLSLKEERKLGVKYVSFDNLFRKSDIVCILVPYTKQTHKLVDMKLIKKMKRTAYLINTARGKIVKEKDLIQALKRKTIAGAALDVFYDEPIGKDNPLTKMENVVLTPHIGSSSAKTREKMAQLTVDNLVLGLAGKKPIYSV